MHICLPYSMLEPIRDLLDAGVQSDQGEKDERWEVAMQEEIKNATVDINSILGRVTLSLNELAHLEVGDVIALEDMDHVVVNAAGVPLFKGSLGVSQGNYAVKVAEVIEQPKTAGIRDLIEADQRERKSI